MTDFSENAYPLLEDDDLPEGHRSGFVAVIGRPNVGKSTLINRLLDEKIAIVSPRPQTTRVRQLGILTNDDAQIIFVDTPGLHKPQHKLGNFMVEVARQALQDADVILFVVEANATPHAGDRAISKQIADSAPDVPVVLVMNKVDLAAPDRLQVNVEEFTDLVRPTEWLTMSALKDKGSGTKDLLARLTARLPPGPRYYPADVVSETNMRLTATELIREQVLLLTHDEVPHAVAVDIDEYKERAEDKTYIRATIYVERDSQKGIIIGKRGGMLKRIGQAARAEIEAITETSVYLDLWVKVLKNWRTNPDMLRRLGYRIR